MKQWCSLLVGLFFSSAISQIAVGIALPVKAQITVDGTTNTSVTPIDNGIRIDEGNRAGNNLFHSFEQFSVLNGSEAFFNNANDLVNIFSRVTGGNISNIDGLIRANGNANLFLINPAGIIFGENASLDIGGSFVASTADSIVFSDNVEFLATDGDNSPLLTINMPIGLNFGNNPGDIAVNSSKLQVNSGKTLALFGGNVTITGGQIIAPGANIELGGLTEVGQVSFEGLGETSFDSISFPEEIARGDVTLSNGAEVNVRGTGGGNISINAHNLKITGGESGASNLRAGIAPESDSISAQAGNIILNATGDITVSQASRIDNRVEELGAGNAGRIDITTTNLFLTDGSQVDASTGGQGDAGAITIDASETISLDGENLEIGSGVIGSGSGIRSRVEESGVGNSGGINLTTTNLSLIGGGTISANTFGRGNAGEITINASDTISADGEGGIFSRVTGAAAIVNSGGINLTTANLFLTQNGTVSASTFAQGNAGAIIINASGTISVDRESGIFSQVVDGEGNAGGIDITTAKLFLREGGFISAGTGGQGNGGDLTVTASESIELVGSDGIFPSGLYANAIDGTGDAGDLIINTDKLTVRDDAVVTAGNFEQVIEGSIEPLPPGKGAAGNLEINARSVEVNNKGKIVADNANGIGGNLRLNADSLTLENEASISASTTADRGQGGILTLNIDDTLIMSDRSLISAKADSGANGGNLTINAEFIIAVPNQNNDIIASAAQGTGGNIDITTNAIFGLEERRNTPPNNTNDIDASSELGLDGTIEINELEVNPAEGLDSLPTEVIDVAGLVEQNLCQQAKYSEFIVTGKGGIAPSPTQPRDGEISEVNLVEPATFEEDGEVVGAQALRPAKEEIVEAEGWIINDRGILELVAYSTDVHSSPAQPKDAKICHQ
ncbi:MAG: filamentous hemagglutinin N-terminal domain-containing protein [Pleurocapsa sp. MO_192.B19]|nr:filamentous hemagglutinin N-terminal domain-containing protein [Pleurocapsa sp. MO_192.B19]